MKLTSNGDSTRRFGSSRYPKAYSGRGIAWHDKGNLDKAIADHNEAIRLDPKDAFAYANRAATWVNIGELDEAIADYNEADPTQPEKSRILFQPRRCLIAKGEHDKAFADYDNAIRIDSEFADAFMKRRCLAPQGRA